MSLPLEQVRCSGCSYEGFIVRRGVTLQYLMPDGRVVKGFRQYVWCSDCDSVQEAESLFNLSEIEADLAKIRAQSGSLWHVLKRMVGMTHTGVEFERDELLVKRDFLKLRQSAPRCLNCAGVRLTALSDEPIHRCGARIYLLAAEEVGLRMSYAHSVVALDIEGRRLESSVS